MKPEQITREHFKYLERAQLLIDVARWREALHELQQHLAAFPDSYEGYCQSALCHFQLKEYQRAYDLTKKAVELSPEDEWAYRLQSLIFTENGEPKRALEAAETCAEKAPYLSSSIGCLFWAQANSGFYDDAEKTLELLRELDPDSAETHEAAGFLALQRKDYLEAEKHYLEALRIDPERVNALNNLGVVYLNLAQSGKGHQYQKKSVEMFERAVRQQPTFELGQKNISLASGAFKIGAPAGLGLLLWFGLQLFGRGAAWMFSDSEASFALTPITSSYLLTATNFLFISLMLAATVYIAGMFISPYKSTLRYYLAVGHAWTIAFVSFVPILVLYVIGLWNPIGESLGMSVAGLFITLILSLVSGINVFNFWRMRRAMR